MNPYVLTFRSPKEIVDEFKKIGVDWGGVDIMRRKAFLRCFKINRLSSFSANILKQEMLSLGGDVAVSRNSLTAKTKETDCLLFGTSSQILNLCVKLKKQPFGLSVLSVNLKKALLNFENDRVVLKFRSRKVLFGKKTFIMGVINATPDSFSGDGLAGVDIERVSAIAIEMARYGADIIDIGGESSRPGAKGVSLKEEARRVLPFVKAIARSTKALISIDTTKAEIAERALDLGASIVNDISALRFDKKMAEVVSRHKAGLVLMHMQGRPMTMQKAPTYKDVVGDIFSFLNDSIKRAEDAGISHDSLVIDPGIGFGKTLEQNLEIIKNLSTFKSLGRPVLIGVSRKGFIGRLLEKNEPSDRGWGTAGAVSTAVSNGADILRVHDVREMAQVIKISDSITRRAYQIKRG